MHSVRHITEMATPLMLRIFSAMFYATRKHRANGKHRIVHRSAFLIHIGTLAFSSLCYFIAFGVLGKNPSEGDQIAKIVLWYFPLVIEVISHFVAANFPGRVRYPAEAIYERSATAFVIILGAGLDKITDGFQYIVGNVSFRLESACLILGAAVIFILLFSLYFGTIAGDNLGSRRALGLFFFNFFYLCALIVTLQAVAAMLAIGVRFNLDASPVLADSSAEHWQRIANALRLRNGNRRYLGRKGIRAPFERVGFRH